MCSTKSLRKDLSIGTNSFLVGLQTKIVWAILTFCPIFCYLSYCDVSDEIDQKMKVSQNISAQAEEEEVI